MVNGEAGKMDVSYCCHPGPGLRETCRDGGTMSDGLV